jgi:hypothetical protein
LPSSGNRERDAAGFGRALPSFVLDGHVLFYAFVNCDHQPARDELRGRAAPMPRRILHGNGNFVWETRVQDIVLNPKADATVFRPPIPAGYSVTRQGPDEAGTRTIAGGQAGAVTRVQEISRQAREMLSTDQEAQRAPPDYTWLTPWLVGCAGAVLGLTTLVALWRRRR